MAFKEFIKVKYFVATVVGGIATLVAVYGFDKTKFIPQEFFFWEWSFIIPVFLAAYMIAYIHERIPPCPTQYIYKIPRYVGIIFLLIFFVLLFFTRPPDLSALLDVAAIAFIFSAVPSIVIVPTLYQFSPGKEVHYPNRK